MILFFDDYLGAEENQLFLLRLRRVAGKATTVEVVEEKTLRSVEEKLRTISFKAAILDVMVYVPEDTALSALAGIEVLRRCRSGAYGDLNKGIPIFMRTARGEPHVRNMALRYGCTNYFQAGSDDIELIKAIMTVLGIRD